jgi:hypothetical protein
MNGLILSCAAPISLRDGNFIVNSFLKNKKKLPFKWQLHRTLPEPPAGTQRPSELSERPQLPAVESWRARPRLGQVAVARAGSARPRLSGGAYQPVLKRIDEFLEVSLRKALSWSNSAFLWG